MFRTNLFTVLVGIEGVFVNALGSDYHFGERDESGEIAEENAEENAGGNAGGNEAATGKQSLVQAIADFFAVHKSRYFGGLSDIVATVWAEEQDTR